MENSLDESRMNKLEFVRERTNPYPERFEKIHELKDIITLEDGTPGVRTAGRIVLMRKMGKLSFLTISDVNGKVQIAIKKDAVGEEEYEFFKRSFDIGDFIGAEGDIFTTQTVENFTRYKNLFSGKSITNTSGEVSWNNEYRQLLSPEISRSDYEQGNERTIPS